MRRVSGLLVTVVLTFGATISVFAAPTPGAEDSTVPVGSELPATPEGKGRGPKEPPQQKPVRIIRQRDSAVPQYIGPAPGGGGDISILDHNPPDCDRCVGNADWTIHDYGAYEYVNYDFAYNDALEIISSQEVHGTLIRNDGYMPCSDPDRYEGEQVWVVFPVWVYNQMGVRIGPSGWKYGDNDTWVRTSGHTWVDDGKMWEIKGQLDRCIDL